ncbi:MAG: hypothetical protein M3421_10690 [Bacteroidota bacterium]|jgi:high-affinity Fe2+/Pb2+ permease|nr:hypothetical protein [Bacteroidota bacterium]
MSNKVKKIIIGVLILAIIAIFIYLWVMVTLWAIAFLATILVVALIVFSLFKLKAWLKTKKRNPVY